MPYYSQESKDQLSTCHNLLQEIFNAVILDFDVKILQGWRDEETQNRYYKQGATQVKWPFSTHNHTINGKPCSLGVDVAPYPIDWEDRERFTLLAGYVIGRAQERGIIIRWGGCWKMDWNPKANKFDDLGHYELVL